MSEAVQRDLAALSASAPVPAAPAASLSGRLLRRVVATARRPEQGADALHFAPRPVQLALPLSHDPEMARAGELPTLFQDSRRVEAVLSYEQASLDQIIPDTAPTPGAPSERLILPGGTGLALFEDQTGSLAFDWMRWGLHAGANDPAGPAIGATIAGPALSSSARAMRRWARHRCIIPLTRYSLPMLQGGVWTHRWLSPAAGGVVCVAGIWAAGEGSGRRFAMVTGPVAGEPNGVGPLLLAERDYFHWLRAPIKDALAGLADG